MINLELIIGKKGHHWLRSLFDNFTTKYMRPLLVKRKALREIDNSNLVRAANRLAAKEAEFAEEVRIWYDRNRSRTTTAASLLDGDLLNYLSERNDEAAIRIETDEDDNIVHLPEILKSEIGGDMNRFARF